MAPASYFSGGIPQWARRRGSRHFGVSSGDSLAPTVLNVTATNSNGTYGSSDTIHITVQFSEPVLVTGTPKLQLETGTSDHDASYVSGSGTDTLTFDYTPTYPDTSSDLDYKATNSLILNSGTIADAAANNATLTLAAPGAAGSLGANKAIVIAAEWTPANATGAVKIWMDATDNSKITESGGSVSQWRDKSSNAYTYSESTDKPTLSTLNGRQAILGNGTSQFLAMDSPVRILSSGSSYIVAFAIRTVSNVGGYSAVWEDGPGGGAESTNIFISTDTNYGRIGFGARSGGFNRFKFGINATTMTYPISHTFISSYDGSNSNGGWVPRINAVTGFAVNPTSASAYSSTTFGGQFFKNSTGSFLNVVIGEFVIIAGNDATDLSNLITYMENRWGTTP